MILSTLPDKLEYYKHATEECHNSLRTYNQLARGAASIAIKFAESIGDGKGTVRAYYAPLGNGLHHWNVTGIAETEDVEIIRSFVATTHGSRGPIGVSIRTVELTQEDQVEQRIGRDYRLFPVDTLVHPNFGLDDNMTSEESQIEIMDYSKARILESAHVFELFTALPNIRDL